jgi:hypothetical protein
MQTIQATDLHTYMSEHRTHLSKLFSGPRGKISSAPVRPSRTLLAKKGNSVTCQESQTVTEGNLRLDTTENSSNEPDVSVNNNI